MSNKQKRLEKKKAKAKANVNVSHVARPKRILWASVSCLLDTASGCAMSMRELLLHLVKRGYQVSILTATVFDTQTGMQRVAPYWDQIKEKIGSLVKFSDDKLIHHLVPTRSINRYQLNALDEADFFKQYVSFLDTFKPDVVLTYGGYVLDFCMMDEAADRRIPTVAYLANSQYQDTRWCRDIDLLLTNSQASAKMYEESQGFKPIPIGVTINPEKVVAEQHERKHVLFVNPSLPKGVTISIGCALLLEKKRPDIKFEIVQSRGDWDKIFQLTMQALGLQRTSLDNIIVTPNTLDMRPIYGRARLTLMPTLCFENFGRVAVESLLNGIPVIASNRGGLPEVVQGGGIIVTFPSAAYEPPYNQAVKLETLVPLANFIEKCYDDEAFYNSYVEKAFNAGKAYAPDVTVDKFLGAIKHLLDLRVGDRDANAPRMHPHKQVPPKK